MPETEENILESLSGVSRLFAEDKPALPDIVPYSFPGIGEEPEKPTEKNTTDGFRSVFGGGGLSYTAEQAGSKSGRYETAHSVWSSLPDIRRAEEEKRQQRKQQKEQSKLDQFLNSEAFKKQLHDMYQKGLEQGLKEGREEAGAELLDDLKTQAQVQGREQGFADGFADGFSAGQQQGVDEGRLAVGQQKVFMNNLNAELETYKRLLSEDQIKQSGRLLERLLIEVVRGELKLAPEHSETGVFDDGSKR